MPTGTVARISIQLLANPTQLLKGFTSAQIAISNFSSSASSILTKLAGLGAGLGAGGVIGFGVKLAADLEKTRIAFEVMIGNAERAKSVLEDIRKFSDSTPFEFADLKDVSQALLAANVAAEDLLPTLSMLGDIALGDAVKLGLIAKAYTDVSSKGRLQGQEIRQFSENGVPLLAALAKQFGKTTAEIVKMSEAGQISFADVQRALIGMVQEGGTRFGLMDRQSQTLSGRWSTLVDTAKRLATEIGERLMPAAKRAVEAFIGLTNSVRGLASSVSINAVKIAAFAAAWIAFTLVGVRVVSAIGAIVKALRSLAIGQAVVTALSSPKGLAQLAISAAAAAGAFALVDRAFKPLIAFAEQSSEISQKAAEGIERIKDSIKDAGTQDPLALKAAAENAKQLEQQMERLRDRAESITQSLRTPVEVFIDTVKELQTLQASDLITGSTFERGIEKARDDFRKAIDKGGFEKISITPPAGIGAASRFTAEGFSAVQEGNRMLSAMKVAEKIQRDQLEQEKIQNAKLDEIIKNTGRPPIVLGVADL